MNQDTKRFIYAPPIFDTKIMSSRRLPAAPYSSAPSWKCSIFYYWWEYLRCNEQYQSTCKARGRGPLAELYQDFGNVHEGSFKQWWKARGEHLFAEPPPQHVVREIKSNSIYRLPGVAIVQIPLQQSLHVSLAQIRSLLSDRVAKAKGTAPRQVERSQALYPVAAKAHLSALDQYLRAWKMRRRWPRETLFELAERLDINPPAKTSPSDWKYRAVMTNEASRRIRTANNLIAYVGKGIFPQYQHKVVYRLMLGLD